MIDIALIIIHLLATLMWLVVASSSNNDICVIALAGVLIVMHVGFIAFHTSNIIAKSGS